MSKRGEAQDSISCMLLAQVPTRNQITSRSLQRRWSGS
jgi:hypothetical protein